MTVTSSGDRPSTDLATKFTMPFTVGGVSSMPGVRSKSTAAVAGVLCAAKTVFSGRTMWTLASLTPEMDLTVLVSSPERALV